MKKLQCEICGGALVMDGGMAVCESCGMKFSKEEVKKMVVELSGPIQIDGEVKVSGMEDADAIYRRAKDFERIGELEDAYYTYRDAADKYPGDGRMWLGKASTQVSIKIEKCEEELLENSDGNGKYYITHEFKRSFGSPEWYGEIEKYYVRAQSLGLADETQQYMLWFHNQKEAVTQKYKDKKRIYDTYHYWEEANAKFLNNFQKKEDALAFILKRDTKELHTELKSIISYNFTRIKAFKGVQGREIYLEYDWYEHNKYGSLSGSRSKTLNLPEGMTIEGDIRPMMDGFTYKEKGLFGSRKTYSFANDPDKDKGPVFEFEE